MLLEPNTPGWIDVHAHHRHWEAHFLFCRNGYHRLNPESIRKIPYGISIGLHPWQAEKDQAMLQSRFRSCLMEKNVLALGECGLDRLRGPEWKIQLNAFKWQFELAQETRTPIIVHCVKAWSDFLPFLKMSQVPMLFHGFSGKRSVTEMLQSFEQTWFSIGPSFFRQNNWAEKIQLLNRDRICLESDTEKSAPFVEMTAALASVWGENTEITRIRLNENAIRFFGTKGSVFF